MSLNSQRLAQLLETYPWIFAAWYDNPADPHAIHVLHRHEAQSTRIVLPHSANSLELIRHVSAPIRTLVADVASTDQANAHQACQDEPIRCGCQCQPQAANWVGTAGAPVSWRDHQNTRCFGILSNWHVLASGQEEIGRTIHQPTTARATFARLSRWKTVSPSSTNLFDAAIADAKIGDLHSISAQVLELGPLTPTPLRATMGLECSKSGRTTGLTHATCQAVGATVRVSYGDFTALYEDQDIFLSIGTSFSAPGDSGSLIVDRRSHSPVSLLFAGSSEVTIGNPIRHVVDHFGLSFDLN